MLHTLPGHRHRGHARLCLRALAHRHLELGLTPFLHTDDDNPAPRALFRAMGFGPTGTRVKFLDFEPA